ncbi:hypothetical protein KRR40_44095 [Niabella defluvii]|nr:hypothetical protein KRR40_44095 [Niabella sp. I65]
MLVSDLARLAKINPTPISKNNMYTVSRIISAKVSAPLINVNFKKKCPKRINTTTLIS